MVIVGLSVNGMYVVNSTDWVAQRRFSVIAPVWFEVSIDKDGGKPFASFELPT